MRYRTLAALGLVGLALLLTWRATTLIGLPDIGDPFDVAAFVAHSVPDDRNAFVLYRQASDRMRPEPQGDGGYDWATTSQSKRDWLLADREALALWRRGTERPEALYIAPKDLTFATMLPVIQDLRNLSRLAQLEASRLQAEGDLASALDWYAAILRSGKHCGHHGLTIERLVGRGIYQVGCQRLIQWATDPRVTPDLLRRAIAEVYACDALAASPSESLRAEYVSFLHSLPDPKLLRPELIGDELPRAYHWPGGRVLLEDLPRIFKREPERSRRVVRLMFANWLAVADLPADRRPPRASAPAVRPGAYLLQEDLMAQLFVLDADAPASARALPPAALARWWDSTLYARRFTPSIDGLLASETRDLANRAGVLLALGNELYRRDHGANPDRPEDLVGPYLKAVPEGHKAPR